MTYLAYGLGISSEIELPELPEAPPGTATGVCVRAASAEEAERLAPEGDIEQVQPSISTRDGDLTVAFGDAATFTISAQARVITCHSHGTHWATVRHLLLDQVLPRWIAAKELMVLHASAALDEGAGAVAFAAPSRGGKSTLIARLGGLGALIVSDDALVIRATPDGALAVPSYPGLRLDPDVIATLGEDVATMPLGGGATKRRVLGGGGLAFAGDPAPLKAIAVLAPKRGGAPDLSRLRGAAAVDALLRASFPPLGRDADARLFENAARLAASVPVLHLVTPWDAPAHRVLGAVRKACA